MSVRGESAMRAPSIAKLIESEPIEIRTRSRIKVWAFNNGYTLIFLSAMFIITWLFDWFA